MPSPFGTALVIANPLSGRGTISKRRPSLEGAFRDAGLEYEFVFTERRGHATELAKRGLNEGFGFLVAAGGDGTVHEVVNGIMELQSQTESGPVLGVLPAGSGCDFARTFGLPQSPEPAVLHLTGDATYQIDVGRVTTTTEQGDQTVYFNNIAQAGFGSDVVKFAEGLPRWVGRVRYLISFWFTLASFRIDEGTVILNDRTHEGAITSVIIANGQFFGGGMHISPNSNPADGRFDVLVQGGTKRDYVAGITKVYKGEHLKMPVIKQYYGTRVEVMTHRPLRVEADGEVLGTTPATFEIVPSAIRLKV